MADNISMRFKAIDLILIEINAANTFLQIIIEYKIFAGIAGRLDLFVLHKLTPIFEKFPKQSFGNFFECPIRGKIISSRTAVRDELP